MPKPPIREDHSSPINDGGILARYGESVKYAIDQRQYVNYTLFRTVLFRVLHRLR